MRKIIIFLTIFIIILFPNFLPSHVNHYGNLKYLEYEIYLNNELIGTHVFNFKTRPSSSHADRTNWNVAISAHGCAQGPGPRTTIFWY